MKKVLVFLLAGAFMSGCATQSSQPPSGPPIFRSDNPCAGKSAVRVRQCWENTLSTSTANVLISNSAVKICDSYYHNKANFWGWAAEAEAWLKKPLNSVISPIGAYRCYAAGFGSYKYESGTCSLEHVRVEMANRKRYKSESRVYIYPYTVTPYYRYYPYYFTPYYGGGYYQRPYVWGYFNWWQGF